MNTTSQDLIEDLNVVPKTINSLNDFISILCPEHGLYYKSVRQIQRQDTECPKCQFLKPSRMIDILIAARAEIELDISWLSFYKKNIRNKNSSLIFETKALYYKLHLVHKETKLEFQKIGILSTTDEKSTGDIKIDFNQMWNPFKWKGFTITPVDKIECSLLEASTIEALYQKNNIDLKITIPNELGFNTNKTYLPDFIWQAKSKTIKPLRDAILNKQKGLCAVCGKPVKDPTLDHMHQKRIKGTGFIRATVCSLCNTFIARSENNAARHGITTAELPEVLRRMADHIEDQKPIIHPTEVPKRKKVGVREWNKVKKHYFKVFPRKRILPNKPTYVTDSWLELKKEVNDYLQIAS